MESTGVYSKAVQRALAEAGVEVWVVDARHVTRVPGSKTDVSDSQWLATLARYGLVNPSFVAPPRLEDLRRLTRLYARTHGGWRRRKRNMLHRMLNESGLRIGIFSRTCSVCRDVVCWTAWSRGQDPEQMVQGALGKGLE